jgi:hypothetical protein
MGSDGYFFTGIHLAHQEGVLRVALYNGPLVQADPHDQRWHDDVFV